MLKPNPPDWKTRLGNLIGLITGLAIDLATKALAERYLQGNPPRSVVGSYFILTYSENRGAFLSFGAAFSGPLWTILFVAVPIIVIGGIVYYLFFRPSTALARWAYVLVTAGGLGNILDRIFRQGYVRDFLNFGIGRLRTGILNIADLLVTIGVILLLIGYRSPAEPETAQ